MGENKTLEKKANVEKWQLNIQLEHASRDTPHQNSMVETGFSHILNKARDLLIDVSAPCLTRCEVIQEAIIITTKLDGLVTKLEGKELKIRRELF